MSAPINAAAPWLHVVGVGLDGLDGLSPAARALVEGAEVLVGGERHQGLVVETSAERMCWPSPFDALIEQLQARRGRRVVVLVTGDPLWFSVGAKIARALPEGSVVFHPHFAAFQLAACRLGWSLADVETLTAHGRPHERLIPWFWPGARLLVLAQDGETPAQVARLLRERGFGPSRLIALANMGGAAESRTEGAASDWTGAVADFHLLAIDCRAEPGAALPPRVGLPDAAFRHDGQITKREIRSLTLARLDPRRGALLWDIGAGCGSVAVEWMRAALDAEAIGVEPLAERRAMAAENALTLGAPRLRLVAGRAPEALAELPAPDAVFIGGGLSAELVEVCLARLKPFGRLAANAVTLEREALLADMQARHGGDLVRLSVARAEPVGGFRGWRPMMTVTQWSLGR